MLMDSKELVGVLVEEPFSNPLLILIGIPSLMMSIFAIVVFFGSFASSTKKERIIFGVIALLITAGAYAVFSVLYDKESTSGRTVWYDKAEEALSYEVTVDELMGVQLFTKVDDGFVGNVSLSCERNSEGLFVSRSLDVDGLLLNFVMEQVDECVNGEKVQETDSSEGRIIKEFKSMSDSERSSVLVKLENISEG